MLYLKRYDRFLEPVQNSYSVNALQHTLLGLNEPTAKIYSYRPIDEQVGKISYQNFQNGPCGHFFKENCFYASFIIYNNHMKISKKNPIY